MKFSEEQTHKVTLHHHTEGDLGEAELRFGGKLGLVAAGGIFSQISKLISKKPLDYVVATGGAYTFTLCPMRLPRLWGKPLLEVPGVRKPQRDSVQPDRNPIQRSIGMVFAVGAR